MNHYSLTITDEILCLNNTGKTSQWHHLGDAFYKGKYCASNCRLQDSVCIFGFGIANHDYIWIAYQILKPNIGSRLTIRCAKTELI